MGVGRQQRSFFPMLLETRRTLQLQPHPPGAASTSPPAHDPGIADKRGLLGSGDEEDVQFLEALKGLVDGAVKLLGADKGVGTWLMSGLLRKSGMVDVRFESSARGVSLKHD